MVNNKGKISQQTRERVLDYVEKNGYVAMSNARILSSKKSWTIGVIFSDISLIGFEHPFFSRILQSFKNDVEARGYEIVMIVSKLGQHELTYLEWCRNKKVDGVLIVMGNINKSNIIEIVQSDMPTVSTDIVMPNLDSVIGDDDMGIRLAIEHAVDLGKQQIVMVSGPDSSRSFVDRMDAFRKYMTHYGRSYKESDIIVADGFDTDAGIRAAMHVVSMHHRPDFVVVASDVIAFGVIRGLEAHGIRVPEDISVIGYDDIDFAQHFTPSLTTIFQDPALIGVEAAKRLMALIDHRKPSKPFVKKIPVSLKVRSSSKS